MTSLTKSHDGALNHIDELFCIAYIKHFEQGIAWEEATGKTSKYAGQNGHKRLQKPVVQARLRELAGQKLEKHDAGAERLMNELVSIAFLDPDDYMTINPYGEPEIDLAKCTPDIRRLLKIKFGIGLSKDGDKIRTYQVEAYDKMDAIEKLLKIHQLYRGEDVTQNNQAIHVNVNFPLPGTGWRNNTPEESEPIDAEDL